MPITMGSPLKSTIVLFNYRPQYATHRHPGDSYGFSTERSFSNSEYGFE